LLPSFFYHCSHNKSSIQERASALPIDDRQLKREEVPPEGKCKDFPCSLGMAVRFLLTRKLSYVY